MDAAASVKGGNANPPDAVHGAAVPTATSPDFATREEKNGVNLESATPGNGAGRPPP